jgi:hypothetical protein
LNTRNHVKNPNAKPDQDDLEEDEPATSKQLTDDELFAACGGVTAHKGARHGFNMSAKAKRVELMDQQFRRDQMAAKTAEKNKEKRRRKSPRNEKLN